MTTATYHHGALREALLTEAIAVARERGPEGLVLRELARRVGVSHNAAYRHFADRDALVAAVAEQGHTALTAAGRARLAALPDVDPVLRARLGLAELGRSYVAFALSEPGLFRVLFAAYPEVVPGAEGDDPLRQLNDALDALVDVGYLAPAARPGAEISCWSAVHGFAVLHLDGLLRDTPDVERDAALEVMLTALDRGYGATTGSYVPL